jgi:hypothetical protein
MISARAWWSSGPFFSAAKRVSMNCEAAWVVSEEEEVGVVADRRMGLGWRLRHWVRKSIVPGVFGELELELELEVG